MSKRKYLVIFVIVLISLMLGKNVYAVNLKLDANKKDVAKGEEVVLTFKTSDFNGESINTIHGEFVYNKDDFEIVKNDNFEGLNNWTVIYNDEEDSKGDFIFISLSGKTKDEEVCRVTLKAKEKTIGRNSEIKLANLETANEDGIIKMKDVSSTVKVKGNEYIIVIAVLVILIVLAAAYTIFKIKNYKK